MSGKLTFLGYMTALVATNNTVDMETEPSEIQFENGSDHAVVASYSELYEEGEVEHINGVWPVFLLKTAKISSNYVMASTSRGVASLRVTIKAPHFFATSAFGLAPQSAWSFSSPVAYQQHYPTPDTQP